MERSAVVTRQRFLAKAALNTEASLGLLTDAVLAFADYRSKAVCLPTARFTRVSRTAADQ